MLFLTERLRDSLVEATLTAEVHELKKSEEIANQIRDLLKLLARKAQSHPSEVFSLNQLFESWYLGAKEISESIASGNRKLEDSLSEIAESNAQSEAFMRKLKSFREDGHKLFMTSISQTAQVSEQSLRLGSFLLVACLVLFVGIFISVRIFVIRPLVSLAHASDQVAKGGYPNVPELRVRDELGILSSNFNAMVSHVSHPIQFCVLS